MCHVRRFHQIFTVALLMLLLVSIQPVLADGDGQPLLKDHCALDVEGRYYGDGGSMPRPVPDAANKQKSIGYTPEICDRPARNLIKNELPLVGIFFFHGHGKPGQFETDERADEYYNARGSSEGYNIDTIGSLTHLKLALLQGCYTGTSSPNYGNVVDSIYHAGGACAMGFTSQIRGPGDVDYSETFWSEVTNGTSYITAHRMAVEFVTEKYGKKGNGKCIGPEKCNGTCCLDQMHYNGCIGGLDKGRQERISFEQGRVIAEAAARVDNPDLFQNTSNKEMTFYSVNFELSENDREFRYRWAENLYYPDRFTQPHFVINGLNDSYITVSPYTGKIETHYSTIELLDPTLSLNPTLTEAQAREIAKKFATKQFRFTERGKTPDTSAWDVGYLLITRKMNFETDLPDTDPQQHLAWEFGTRPGSDPYLIGGDVSIDAHTGEVLGYNEIV